MTSTADNLLNKLKPPLSILVYVYHELFAVKHLFRDLLELFQKTKRHIKYVTFP
jgi:hypothetical protein